MGWDFTERDEALSDVEFFNAHTSGHRATRIVFLSTCLPAAEPTGKRQREAHGRTSLNTWSIRLCSVCKVFCKCWFSAFRSWINSWRLIFSRSSSAFTGF